MSLTVSIDTRDWDTKSEMLSRGIVKIPRLIVERGTAILEEELRNTVPVVTGKLRASVIRHSLSDLGGKVSTSSGYGVYVDEGTGPHVILGKPLLRFEVDGKVIFARRVFHPGFLGRHFKERSMESASPLIRQDIVDIIKQEMGFT